MTIKHTPGPWLFDEERDAITTHNRITTGKTRIATVELGWAEPFESEQIANARLIAATPDLLEALQNIAEYWNQDQNETAMADACWHAIHTAHAAIAKATGEQP